MDDSRAGLRGRWARPGPDSGFWLVAVGVAFTAAELLFVSPRMGLSWDEAVYVSQVSGHAPAAWFDPARARGVPLLVAPVAALTSSVAALRVYLSVACGLGLTVALWTWRRLRPAWVLGLAGVLFGGLWVAQYYGPQAMPDMWSALGGLAAVGCFLRGGRKALAGLGASVAFVTLIRPGDAVYLAAPLVLAAIVIWRSWPRAAVVVGGLVAGGAEWVAEAYARFGGIASRLHAAGAEQGGFGLHFALLDELRALNGPTLCRPCTIGIRYPELDLWWFLLPVLVGLAVLAARRARGPSGPSGPSLSSVLLPAVCGLCVGAQYLFMINYAAPRFLLPAYALLAVPAADGLAFLITGLGHELRPAMTAAVTCFLIVQLRGPAPRPRSRGGRDRDVPRRLHADRHRAGRRRRPAAVPDPGGAVHPDRLLRRLCVRRDRGAGRPRCPAGPGRPPAAFVRQELARVPHHRYRRPQGQRLHPAVTA